MINIVIPMAGYGSRFSEAGYKLPKPLIPVGNTAMIELVANNLTPDSDHRFIFICLKEHTEIYPQLTPLLQRIAPHCEIITIPAVTEGAACTVMLAHDFIANNDELVIANSDQLVDLDINDFINYCVKSKDDGVIMTFDSSDPKWSYCRLNSTRHVLEVAEKKVISRHATVGIYFFRQGIKFTNAASKMIDDGARQNNEFYVAPCYNYLIHEGAKIGVFNIGDDGLVMHGLGTPADLRAFEEKFLRSS